MSCPDRMVQAMCSAQATLVLGQTRRAQSFVIFGSLYIEISLRSDTPVSLCTKHGAAVSSPGCTCPSAAADGL